MIVTLPPPLRDWYPPRLEAVRVSRCPRDRRRMAESVAPVTAAVAQVSGIIP